jgi:hypothetical protein
MPLWSSAALAQHSALAPCRCNGALSTTHTRVAAATAATLRHTPPSPRTLAVPPPPSPPPPPMCAHADTPTRAWPSRTIPLFSHTQVYSKGMRSGLFSHSLKCSACVCPRRYADSCLAKQNHATPWDIAGLLAGSNSITQGFVHAISTGVYACVPACVCARACLYVPV